MPVDVTLPQLGESTYEGTIGKWLKHPGDRIERFEPLVEIITDKVNVEMPAPYGGVLSAILIPEGQTVPVGTPIAVMETPEMAAERPGAGMPSTGTGVDIPQDRSRSPEAERLRLSPVVRKLADEHGLPLEEVARLPGTGAGGRVTKEDVLKYVETRHATGPGAPAVAAPRATPAPPGLHPGDQLVKLTPLRRSIAQRMAQSKREIPHAYGVIKQADRKPLVEIARELEALGRRAREGTLTLDEVQGGTFTITNPGVFGSIWSMPIIVPGQAAMLVTDAIVKRPVARDDAIVL